jgi:hypothetical protein
MVGWWFSRTLVRLRGRAQRGRGEKEGRFFSDRQKNCTGPIVVVVVDFETVDLVATPTGNR